MKKLLICLICLGLLCSLSGCGLLDFGDTSVDSEPVSEAEPFSYQNFSTHLTEQKAVAVNPTVHHNETEDKGIYLCADIKNNAGVTLKDITIAFVAWDIDGNPVLLKSHSGATADSYLKEVGMGDITVEAGQTWLAETDSDIFGFRVADTQTNISYVRACVVSYAQEDGAVWNNPLYPEWNEVYVSKPLTEEMKAIA